jgi:hypothetical protein
MVTRVHKHREDRFSPEGQILEIEGREELSISVGINGQRYEDWISIDSYEGSVELKGCHVDELITTILRFSSNRMRNHYKEFLDVVNLSTNNPLHHPQPFHPYDVKHEKRRRKCIQEWTDKREKDIQQYRMERWEEDRLSW